MGLSDGVEGAGDDRYGPGWQGWQTEREMRTQDALRRLDAAKAVRAMKLEIDDVDVPRVTILQMLIAASISFCVVLLLGVAYMYRVGII